MIESILTKYMLNIFKKFERRIVYLDECGARSIASCAV